jgi:hypothetical protein
MENGKYTRIVKFVTLIVGVLVLFASVIFSKNGFEFQTTSDYAWIGWVLAFAATCAEFMMGSTFKKMNWTILILGVSAYIYSIYTNMLGFHSLRETDNLWNIINVVGSVFMDVFPEVAISWALEESKVGDLVGNLIKSAQHPETLSQSQPFQAQSRTPQNRDMYNNLPKKRPEQSRRQEVGDTDIPDFMRNQMRRNGKQD